MCNVDQSAHSVIGGCGGHVHTGGVPRILPVGEEQHAQGLQVAIFGRDVDCRATTRVTLIHIDVPLEQLARDRYSSGVHGYAPTH